MENRVYYVYILASGRNETLYVGLTSNIVKRIWAHKNKLVDGFTKRYRIDRLVYYEQFRYVDDAIKREKQLKRWRRKWKLELIEEENVGWRDLYSGMLK